jgi:ABC-2 type transport system ATP-binding protein
VTGRPTLAAGGATTPRPPLVPGAGDAIVLDRVTCRFGETTGVEDLTMRIPAGSLVGMIGPSGAGKTTSVRLMTGGLAATDGTVRVLGENPRAFRHATRSRIGYMPQHFSLYPDLTARENVDFVASLFGMLWPARRRRVPEILRVVDLWDARNRRAGHLSGGMQRRLELAGALVHDPVLLFLDEPTAGIDPLLRTTIWTELRRLRDAGRTLVVTTQYVGEAEECDLVALVAEGRLVALDTPAGLRTSVAGGEIVDLETARPTEAAEREDLPGVRDVAVLGSRRFRVTVGSAAAAIPDLVETLATRGVEVARATERRLSFDEVFAALVGQAREASIGEEAGPERARDTAPGGTRDGLDMLDDLEAAS